MELFAKHRRAEGRIVLGGFDAFISAFIVGAAVQIFVVSLAAGVPSYLARRKAASPSA